MTNFENFHLDEDIERWKVVLYSFRLVTLTLTQSKTATEGYTIQKELLKSFDLNGHFWFHQTENPNLEPPC